MDEVKAWLSASGALDEGSLNTALVAIENESIDGEALLSMSEPEIGELTTALAHVSITALRRRAQPSSGKRLCQRISLVCVV